MRLLASRSVCTEGGACTLSYSWRNTLLQVHHASLAILIIHDVSKRCMLRQRMLCQ